MTLHFFGTCAGTEPLPGRRHASFAVETDGRLYWFDAGEGCSYTASMMGLDLLTVRTIFISHTHMDHVGGLGNLLWNIRKLTNVKGGSPADGRIDLFMPNMESWEGLHKLLLNTEGDFSLSYDFSVHSVSDGLLWDDGHIKVEALHNTHLPYRGDMGWVSFSYRITAEGKTVVFSGDVGTYRDLLPFLRGGCDVLLAETGHHNAEVIARYVSDNGFHVGKLCYFHVGRDLLHDRENAEKSVAAIFPVFTVCEDATSLTL